MQISVARYSVSYSHKSAQQVGRYIDNVYVGG